MRYFILTIGYFLITPLLFSQTPSLQREVKNFIGLNVGLSYDSEQQARQLQGNDVRRFKENFRHPNRLSVIADHHIASNGHFKMLRPGPYARQVTGQFLQLDISYCPQLQVYKLDPERDAELADRLSDLLFVKIDKKGKPKTNREEEIKLRRRQVKQFMADTSIFIALATKSIKGQFRDGNTLSQEMEQVIVFGVPNNTRNDVKVWGVCSKRDLGVGQSRSISLINMPPADKITLFVEQFSEALNQGVSVETLNAFFLSKGTISSDISSMGAREALPVQAYVQQVKDLSFYHQELEVKKVVKHPPKCADPRFWYVVKALVKTRFVESDGQDTIMHVLPLNYSVFFDQEDGEPVDMKIERIVYKDETPIQRIMKPSLQEVVVKAQTSTEEEIARFIKSFYDHLNRFLNGSIPKDTLLPFFESNGDSFSIVVSNCKDGTQETYATAAAYLDHFAALGYDSLHFSIMQDRAEHREDKAQSISSGEGPSLIVNQQFEGGDEGEEVLYGDVTVKEIFLRKNNKGRLVIHKISVIDTEACFAD